MNFRLTLVILLLMPFAADAACNGNVAATKPDARYVDNGDGTVTDTITGLMWKQCTEGWSTTSSPCDTGSWVTYTWQQALQQAGSINSAGFAGYSDWRLPNRNELASLVERQCYTPSINTIVFPNTVPERFWSSSSHTRYSDQAWGVYFSEGYVLNERKDSFNYVRLVRAGQ